MSKKRLIFNSVSTICLFLSVLYAFGQRPVPYLTEPAISPDRKEIAFISGADIWTVPAEGGTAQLLVSNPAIESRPLYSPDNKSLAFVSTRTGNGDIYVLNLENGDLSRVTFDDALDQLDAWSHDGQWLYFSSASKDIAGMNDIFRVRVSGGTPLQVSADRYTNEFYAAPSPDGTSLAFSARGIASNQWWRKGRSHLDESEIWLKKGKNYEQLTEAGAKQLWPMWSADGEQLYFVSDRNGTQNIWTHRINGKSKRLTDFREGRVLWPTISKDGKQIVFERDFRIWTMDAGNGKASPLTIALRGTPASQLVERVNLTGKINEFALSPDGKKVALVARGEIFAASAKDGGEAIRITSTAAPESFVAWSPDSRKLVYTSERDGSMKIFLYDFATESETQLTNNSGDDYSALFSPDGKSLAFYRNKRSLMVYDFDKKQEREICQLYTDAPPIFGTGTMAWSPDNRWLAFLGYAPENRSYTNVNVVSVKGETTAQARPVSFVANSNSGSVSWSPDGTFLLFDTNQRTEEGALARVDLILRTPKFREDAFRDLFKQENPRDKPDQPTTPLPTPLPQTSPTPQVSPSPAISPSPQTSPTPLTSPSQLIGADTGKKDEMKLVEIVFNNIRQRLSLIRTGVSVIDQIVSPDGKTVVVLAAAQGQFNLYALPLDELATDTSARQLTSTASFKTAPQFTPDGKEIYYLENGRVNMVSVDKREVRPLALNLEMNVDFAAEKMEVFNQGWRYLRDHFYDEAFHGINWNAVRTKYQPLVLAARSDTEVRRLMSLMVGELNASHLGVGAPINPAQQPTPIGKLGLRFDSSEYEDNGHLKITDVIALGPAAVTNGIKVGDYLLSVDGIKVNGKTNLDDLLENKVGKRVVLGVAASADSANKREIALKPVSTNNEKNLLYRQWVETNRVYVEQISNGKLGYVHIPDMSSNSLAQLYIDLDVQNQAKDGVVIDLRNNNGGFVNPYVIDVFSRRGYLNMRERGKWTVPARSNLGQRSLERPTILITNQHSLSDAEDFTEGYRLLKLGKVVGEPTAGWIIFTWTTNLFDGTIFRLPRQLITSNDGKNMELNPRPVDVLVKRPIGETLSGRDSQLDVAVRELQTQIAGK